MVDAVPDGLESPRGSPPTVVSGHPTAAAIREAAIGLFAQLGYEGTTMKAIAAKVGIGAPAIYNHVNSKQTLLQEIVSGTMHELINDALAAIDSTDDVAEQLRRAVHGHVVFHAERSHETFIGNREIRSLEEPARRRQIEYRNEYVGVFETLIRRGVATKRFRTRAPHLAAFAILQMGMGVSVWFRGDGEMTASETGDLYGEFALRMLDARPAGG